MAESWQDAWVQVLPDFSDFRRNANSQMTNILGTAGTAGGIAAGQNMGGGILNGIKGLGGPILGAIAALGIGRLVGESIGAGINYGINAVGLASDLEQSTGAVQAVFKEQADAITGYAADAVQAVGLTKNSVQTLATRLGSQLKNLGIPMDAVSGKTLELIGLGSDLAAQFGGPTSDAVNALSSLLRGERDPIEAYGVSFKEADVEAYKLANGLSGLTGEAERQADITATLALLWQQTADAQGAYAREGGSLAQQQEQFNASLEELQTRLGVALLPSATEFFQFANSDLVPIIEQTLGEVGPVVSESLRESLPEMKELLTEAGKVFPDVVRIGLDSLQGDAKTFVDAMRILNGELFDVIGENTAAATTDGTWWGDRLEIYTKNAEEFYALIGFPPTDDANAKWEDYGNRLGAVLAGSENDFSAYNNAIQAGLNDSAGKAYLIGLEIPRGFARGVDVEKHVAVRAVQSMADEVVGTMRSALQIASPSKVFARLGAFTAQGFYEGFNREASGQLKVPTLSVSSVAPAILSGIVPAHGDGTGGTRDVALNVTGVVDPLVVSQIVKQELSSMLTGVH